VLLPLAKSRFIAEDREVILETRDLKADEFKKMLELHAISKTKEKKLQKTQGSTHSGWKPRNKIRAKFGHSTSGGGDGDDDDEDVGSRGVPVLPSIGSIKKGEKK
jgi:hypothetical protein